MAPYLRSVSADRPDLIKALEEKNAKHLDELDGKIKAAEEREGDSEISELLRQKAMYYCRIGDKVRGTSLYCWWRRRGPRYWWVGSGDSGGYGLGRRVPSRCAVRKTVGGAQDRLRAGRLPMHEGQAKKHGSQDGLLCSSSEGVCQIVTVKLIIQEKAVPALELALEKTAGLGARIDLVLAIIRVGLFFQDTSLVTSNITKALE